MFEAGEIIVSNNNIPMAFSSVTNISDNNSNKVLTLNTVTGCVYEPFYNEVFKAFMELGPS